MFFPYQAENPAARCRALLCCGFAASAARLTGPLHAASHPEQMVGGS
jgi:hypothetical protein